MKMRERTTNVVLAVLAASVLVDLFVARVSDGQHLIFPLGLFGALVLQALSDDPKPIVLTAVGVALTGVAVAGNHQAIDRDSFLWFVVTLILAFLYGLWEKIVKWFSY